MWKSYFPDFQKRKEKGKIKADYHREDPDMEKVNQFPEVLHHFPKSICIIFIQKLKDNETTG